MSLRWQLIRADELASPEVGRWEAIRHRTHALDSPFLSAYFVQAVGSVRSDVRVAVIEDGPRIVGFLPFQKHGQVGRALAWGINDRQGIVADPELVVDRRSLLDGCGLSVLAFDHLAVADVERLGVHATIQPSWTAELSGGSDQYLAERMRAHPGHFRSLERKRRKMERHHETELRVNDSDSEAMRLLVRWKAAQYRRTGRRDRFAQRWIVELIELLRSSQAPGCRGMLSTLRLDGEVAAAHFGIASEETLACWFPAYASRHAAFSPGLQLFLGIARAAPGGVHRLDFGKGDESFKPILSNHADAVAEAELIKPSVVATAYTAVRRPGQWAERLVLERPRLRSGAREALKAIGWMRGVARPRHPGDDLGD